MAKDDQFLLERIEDMLDKKLEEVEEALQPKLLYGRREAAKLLSISLASLEILIGRGDIRVQHFGTRQLISREELERVSKKDFSEIWPEKGPNGTRRHIA